MAERPPPRAKRLIQAWNLILSLAIILLAISTKSEDIKTETLKISSLCGNNVKARSLAYIITNDWDQNRKNLKCNQLLSDIAQRKAETMAEYGLVIHNLGGSQNSALREADYELPIYYGEKLNSNQVEAIVGGYSTS